MNNVLDQLIARQLETANVDYKEGFEWSKESRDKRFELIRDIFAMANTRDGGTIILGVKDDTRELVGVSKAMWDSYDQSAVAEMVHQKGTPKVNLQVIKTEIQGKRVVALTVSEFEDVPIICTDTILGSLHTSRTILRKGAVYIRTSGATTEEISSDQDMRELLSRAILKRGDELLRSVERLIKGKPLNPSEDSISLYDAEVKQAEIWFNEVLQKGFHQSPRWELIAHPSQYLPERLSNLADMERMVKESQVRLRGWDFPYLGQRGEVGAFNSGFQGRVDWEAIREAFRLYKSGLFVWKRAIWEDLKDMKTEKGKRTLSYSSAIYSLTEWFLFLARLYESIVNTNSVRILIRVVGCKNRQLASFDGMEAFFFHSDWYESQEDVISFQRDYTVEELRASPAEIAKAFAIHIFQVFNWTKVTDEMIESLQKKVLNRTY